MTNEPSRRKASRFGAATALTSVFLLGALAGPGQAYVFTVSSLDPETEPGNLKASVENTLPPAILGHGVGAFQYQKGNGKAVSEDEDPLGPKKDLDERRRQMIGNLADTMVSARQGHPDDKLIVIGEKAGADYAHAALLLIEEAQKAAAEAEEAAGSEPASKAGRGRSPSKKELSALAAKPGVSSFKVDHFITLSPTKALKKRAVANKSFFPKNVGRWSNYYSKGEPLGGVTHEEKLDAAPPGETPKLELRDAPSLQVVLLLGVGLPSPNRVQIYEKSLTLLRKALSEHAAMLGLKPSDAELTQWTNKLYQGGADAASQIFAEMRDKAAAAAVSKKVIAEAVTTAMKKEKKHKAEVWRAHDGHSFTKDVTVEEGSSTPPPPTVAGQAAQEPGGNPTDIAAAAPAGNTPVNLGDIPKPAQSDVWCDDQGWCTNMGGKAAPGARRR